MPKVVQYRDKCIGCAICVEMQPALWRMSRKDGKATLINAVQKKKVFIIPINAGLLEATEAVARACPVNIIKLQ